MGNDRSFTRTNQTIKNDPIIPKKNKRIERFLKIVGTICKGTERKFFMRTIKIRNIRIIDVNDSVT